MEHLTFKDEDEFIAAAVQLVKRRPGARVMVIVESDMGIETMATFSSFVLSFGILCAAEKLMDERYRSAMAQTSLEREERIGDEIRQSTKPKGGVQ